MTEPQDPPLSESRREKNELALRQLAWAIEASVRHFKLILARCNYASLRLRLVEQLQEICQVELRVLFLQESEKTLYSAIREELGKEIPDCLIILGLESVQNLERMLITANQVREEFRDNFPFPLVLWIDERIHKQMMGVYILIVPLLSNCLSASQATFIILFLRVKNAAPRVPGIFILSEKDMYRLV